MQDIFKKIELELNNNKLKIVDKDLNRPWGGFFVIDENNAQVFANHYFPHIDVNCLKITGKLSPKILIVAPNSKLSWQFHNRRAEIWRVIYGEVGVKKSFSDKEGQLLIAKTGEIVKLEKGERHRLIGLSDYSIIAEIWQHTDINSPSDENDIIRLQDDFGRH